jgi:hypothetical protein
MIEENLVAERIVIESYRVFDELAQVRRGLEPYLGDADIAECADVIEGLVQS